MAAVQPDNRKEPTKFRLAVDTPLRTAGFRLLALAACALALAASYLFGGPAGALACAIVLVVLIFNIR